MSSQPHHTGFWGNLFVSSALISVLPEHTLSIAGLIGGKSPNTVMDSRDGRQATACLIGYEVMMPWSCNKEAALAETQRRGLEAASKNGSGCPIEYDTHEALGVGKYVFKSSTAG